jgi:Tol biopolymer transport system component
VLELVHRARSRSPVDRSRLTARRLGGAIALAIAAGALAIPPALSAPPPNTNERIVFTRGSDGGETIYSMAPDGRDQIALTPGGPLEQRGSPSPDGTKLLFDGPGAGEDSNVHVMDLRTQVVTQLTDDPHSDDQAAWSPDGTKIAFVRETQAEGEEIWTMNADGSGETPLVAVAGFSGDPAWSPDGTTIAYASEEDGDTEIVTVPAAGGASTQLTTNTESDRDPAWSPDGTKIAYATAVSGFHDVWTMDADGANKAALVTFPQEHDVQPTWSPDGTTIAYAHILEIYSIPAAGGTPTPLTSGSDPAWGYVARIAPRAVTEAARDVTAAGATLAGSVDPEGESTSYAFDYGTTTDYGATTAAGAAGSGRDPVAVSAAVGSLAPGTTYHYRLVATSAGGTTAGEDRIFTTAAGPAPPEPDPPPPEPDPPAGPGPLPPPVVGKLANAKPVSGEVLVAVPRGTGARAAATGDGLKGLDFVPLEEARQVPVGSFFDTTGGTVRLATARGSAGRTQQGTFAAGVFQVLQSRRRKARGLTELRLKGGSFRSCAARRGRSAARVARSRLVRRLRSKATGRFRSRGRHSAATVRGTVWTVTDRCDGTLTRVKRGKVAVRDFRRRKTVLVRAGKRYLARAQ